MTPAYIQGSSALKQVPPQPIDINETDTASTKNRLRRMQFLSLKQTATTEDFHLSSHITTQPPLQQFLSFAFKSSYCLSCKLGTDIFSTFARPAVASRSSVSNFAKLFATSICLPYLDIGFGGTSSSFFVSSTALSTPVISDVGGTGGPWMQSGQIGCPHSSTFVPFAMGWVHRLSVWAYDVSQLQHLIPL